MILSWKYFKLSAQSFLDFLLANAPNADGICACPDNFSIVEKRPLTDAEAAAILAYYNSLTEAGEKDKIAANKAAKYEAQKQALAQLFQELGNGEG